MASLRGVREKLRALRDEMADVRQRILWVEHEAGENHTEAVERTLTERGLTGDELGLMLISWLPPGQACARERGAIQ